MVCHFCFCLLVFVILIPNTCIMCCHDGLTCCVDVKKQQHPTNGYNRTHVRTYILALAWLMC